MDQHTVSRSNRNT